MQDRCRIRHRSCTTRRSRGRCRRSAPVVHDPQRDPGVPVGQLRKRDLAVGLVPLCDRVAGGDDRPPGLVGVLVVERPAGDAVGDDVGPEPGGGAAQPREPLAVLGFEVAPLEVGDVALHPAAHPVLDGDPDQRAQSVGRVVAGLAQGEVAAPEVVVGDLLHQRGQQVLLAGVPVVERREGQPGPAGDVPDRGAVVPAFGEALPGGRRDRLPAAAAPGRTRVDLLGGAHRVSMAHRAGARSGGVRTVR